MPYQEQIARARELGWTDIRGLWQRIKAGEVDDWPAGKALEHLLIRAFELADALVQWPYKPRLDGNVVEELDGAVHLDGLWCLVETKDTDKLVNVEPIAKLRNQLMRRPAGTVGLLFSRTGFTYPAKALAQHLAPQTVLLWEADDIEYMLENRNPGPCLVAKYRYCVEHGLPDLSLKVEQP